MADPAKKRQAPQLISTREAAEMLGVDIKTLYKLVRNARIEAIDLSVSATARRRTLRFRRTDIEAFIKGNVVEPQQAA
jgi:excisionase family DNA binding protein